MGKIIQGNFNRTAPGNKTTAIIAAGGKGSRMGLDFNKIFLDVDEKPILAYTLDVFEFADCIDNVILVCSDNDKPLCEEIVSEFGYTKVTRIVKGGETRQESVRNGLAAVPDTTDIVLVHDAARPLVTKEMLKASIDAASKNGAAAVGILPVDTVKRVQGTTVFETIDRNSLVLIQTPQTFRKDLLVQAHETAHQNHQLVTDDCALLELMGHTVTVVPGAKFNIKLTTPEDYAMISAYLTCYRKEDEDD
ncbi:MAG: 2-C-methyl-D-erythritol 4-phosphate cytidylyltransferase [Clostridia bacterium]|nr:2-C-methyl-D-erythritol 4-phosphate cytidylyltransferase [Clostridia bacterium]